jgi:Trk K+ transport system NAD-binding subunit
MKLAVIGSGKVGSAIARAAKRIGHDVVVAAVDPEGLKRLAEELGIGTTRLEVALIEFQ